MALYDFTRSYQMLEEAKKVVPGGIYGPRSPSFLTYGSYPAFMVHGEGCRVWDVDGNEYIDYMCSFGTNVLGLRHPKVEAAARAQWDKGDCFTLPTDRWVEAAHAIVDRVEVADWVVFGKNGSDATNYAVTVARAFTGKKIILKAFGSYHGIGPWCVPIPVGIPEEITALTKQFPYGDLNAARALFEAHKDNIACVIITPMKHDTFQNIEFPTREFLDGVRKLCDEQGALLISDDIRCGFRLDMGGSHVYFGYKPDMVTFGKAMANGYPIAVATGSERLKEIAQRVFYSGTHFFSGVPMAAAIACMKAIEEEGAIAHMAEMGKLLRQGLDEQSKKYGVPVTNSGPPAIPYMIFAKDMNFDKARYFCGEAAKRGIFLHPHHNWFLSAAHKQADIEKTLKVTDECFKLTKEKFGDK
jgi:glutamate-1-semialdehyde 2,1-aminomutase